MAIPRQDLAQDRAFWNDILALNAESQGLPQHSAGGYRNRRFVIIRNAAWITQYRAQHRFPQVGVFLRCNGLAGEAFFALAECARPAIETRLRAELELEETLECGSSYHPGMIDIAAILPSPLPWNDSASAAYRLDATGRRCLVDYFVSLAEAP